MTARRISAVLGAAFAAAAVVFTSSLVATNDRQAVSVAERLLAAIPVKAGARTVSLAADYRPGGRVMQGPPLMAHPGQVCRLKRRSRNRSSPRGVSIRLPSARLSSSSVAKGRTR